MSRIRILFMGTPAFAAESLRKLSQDDHFEIVGVVTQPDRPAGRKLTLVPPEVKVLAEKLGFKVFQPETVNSAAFREEIGKLGAEAAVVVAFGQILGTKFMQLFPNGCVNVHASLLPRWRGAAPIQRALMAGDLESGVALQVMVKALDAGPVLGIRKIRLTDDMDAIRLHDELKVLGADLLQVEFMDYLRGNLTPVPQDESLVTLAPKIEKSESHVSAEMWKAPARSVFNHIRGLAMGPVCYSKLNGKMMKLVRTRVESESGALGRAGEVLAIQSDRIVVACGVGSLAIFDIQPESRKAMPVSDFIKGYELKTGECFS